MVQPRTSRANMANSARASAWGSAAHAQALSSLGAAEEELDALAGLQTGTIHVARILQKLAVHDRVQAVIYAYETGLVTPGAA